jgi:3-deoxy-7-phosphoheptulonate synthase
MPNEIEIALRNLRERIDEIDSNLIDLLEQRAVVVEEVGRIKKEHNLPIYQPQREEQVYEHVTAQAKGPLPPEAIRQVFEGIVDQMRKIQRNNAERPKDGEPMLVVMEQGAGESAIETVITRLMDGGFDVHRSTSAVHTVLGAVGGRPDFDTTVFEVMPGVKEVHRLVSPYKLANRVFKPQGSIVRAGNVEFGGPEVVVIAGPCSVESREQIEMAVDIVADGGAKALRGGAFKPRSSPYAFQGLGEEGLRMMRAAADRRGLIVVSEVMDATQIPLLCDYADVLQIGARNMQNFNLLRELGRIRKPVMLKRGLSATIEELLLSAEYILSGGNYDVILCERGIRTFETYTRNTFDVSAIPVVKKLSHLPIIGDPSHGTGRREHVAPMARAAIAAGADGLLMEVHHDPDHALSDGAQTLNPAQYYELMRQLRTIAPAVGRSLA